MDSLLSYATLHSIATVAAFVAFIGILWWAYRPASRSHFEALGRLPLEDDRALNRANQHRPAPEKKV